MIYVIPSLARVATINKKTLNLLKDIPKETIYVFVIKEEYELYRTNIDERIAVIIGPLGLHNMRNFIRFYFPENTKMVCMDDDIKNLYKMIPEHNKYNLHALIDVHVFFTEAFDHLEATGLTFFGIYPVKNGYFMKSLPETSTNLRFCVGTVWGCINSHSNDLRIHIEEKEDFERTLLYYKKDKGVLRFNRICADTKYYTEKGGLQSRGIDRKETSKQSCTYLINCFPEYCKPHTTKKSGVQEVRLFTKK
jgi:hypothetical protein